MNNKIGATQNEVNIDDELQKLIKKLAILSVEEKIKVTEITSRFSKERRRYIESLTVISEENKDEKEFREKAELFFRSQMSRYLEEELPLRARYKPERKEFEISSLIEIACASYSLYKVCANITQNAIYEKAREKMPEKKSSEKRCWGSKFDRVRFYTSKCLPSILDEVINDKNVQNNCFDFLAKYDYRRGTEETMLKLIFLIENCNS